ncbi:MAG: hypothetical protein KH020_18570 [Clostridiales bacterium]|nr:hypothetical protein [Clostridiales bacterium]
MNHQFVKVKFLKDNKPHGRAYIYNVPEGLLLETGDIVQINSKSTGIVVDEEIDVAWLKTYGAENLKEIIGKVEEK